MKKLMSVLLGLSLFVAVAAPSFADGDDTKKDGTTKKKGKKGKKKSDTPEAPKK